MTMNIPPHDPDRVASVDGFFDPDASNGLRARSAHKAVLHYQEQGFDDDEHTCAIDLLTDLLHFIHSLRESPVRKPRITGWSFPICHCGSIHTDIATVPTSVPTAVVMIQAIRDKAIGKR